MSTTTDTRAFTFVRWTNQGGDDAILALAEQHHRGRREGWTIALYANGQKACEGRFEGGVEHGWWIFWSRDGVPRAGIEFANGIPIRQVANADFGVPSSVADAPSRATPAANHEPMQLAG